MKDLRGANAIVTGASKGIGIYIAKTLAGRGVNIALAARSAERLEEARGASEALVLPAMIERGRVVLVQVSSLAGKSGEPYGAIYSATKAGLIALTSALNMELDGTGVRCGTVCPGYVGEAGMWVTQGLKAPAMLKEVPAQKVADAVMKAIGGAPLAYVTSGPIRPLLALGELWPGLNLWITRR